MKGYWFNPIKQLGVKFNQTQGRRPKLTAVGIRPELLNEIKVLGMKSSPPLNAAQMLESILLQKGLKGVTNEKMVILCRTH